MLMHTNMAGHVGYVGLAYNAPYPLNTTRCCLWPGRPPRLRLMRPPVGVGGAQRQLLTERPLRNLSGVPRRGRRHCGLGLNLIC